IDVGGVREPDLGADAAGEIDGQIHGAREERRQRHDHEHGRQRVPHLARGHEGIAGLMTEKFHLWSLRLAVPEVLSQIDRRAILRRPPYMRVSSARLPISEVSIIDSSAVNSTTLASSTRSATRPKVL